MNWENATPEQIKAELDELRNGWDGIMRTAGPPLARPLPDEQMFDRDIAALRSVSLAGKIWMQNARTA